MQRGIRILDHVLQLAPEAEDKETVIILKEAVVTCEQYLLGVLF